MRLTNPRQDLKAMLIEWIQSNKAYRVQDCLEDLQHIAELRSLIAERISSKQAHPEAVSIRSKLHYYYHCLLECERHRIGLDDSPQRTMTLEWESAMMVELQVGHTIPWERTNLLWNLASLDAYQAYHQPKDEAGWEEASKQLQHAASWLHQLSSNNKHKPFPFLDFYPSLIRLWKGLLLAESQRCTFEALLCTSKPNHNLLAKVATAAASMYSSLQYILQQGQQTATTPIFNQPLVKEWGDLTASLVLYMKCMAAFHLSVDAQERIRHAEEMSLLEVAHREANSCRQASQDSAVLSLQELHANVSSTLADIKVRLKVAQSEAMRTNHEAVSQDEEPPSVEGQIVAQVLPLEQILRAYLGEPIFVNLRPSLAAAAVAQKDIPPNSNMIDKQTLKKCADMFRGDMEQLIDPLRISMEDGRESARQALAALKLPHSLTAHRQELQGGGIPIDLWIKVEALQRGRHVDRVKRELWDLRDISARARSICQQARSQLDLDLESDESFRNDNPTFLGRDTPQIQRSYRRQLENYDRLLATAQEGDAVLSQRVDRIDNDPKFKLLKFKQGQLDKLLPAVASNSPFDVAPLSRVLLSLSRHFGDREAMLEKLEQDIKAFDIEDELRSMMEETCSSGERSFIRLVAHCETSFRTRAADIESLIEKQEELMILILAENEKFAKSRRGPCCSSDSCISILEGAVGEIDEVTMHFREGKHFYSVITHRLEKLRNLVDEVSTKLTVERLEYDDSESRDRQEEADALMAKRLSQDTPAVAAAAANGVARGQPGWVDDEKVATLVAMDFDPDRVLDALKNQNNDVDAALNELLSGA